MEDFETFLRDAEVQIGIIKAVIDEGLGDRLIAVARDGFVGQLAGESAIAQGGSCALAAAAARMGTADIAKGFPPAPASRPWRALTCSRP